MPGLLRWDVIKMKQTVLILLLSASLPALAANNVAVSPSPAAGSGNKTFEEVSKSIPVDSKAKDLFKETRERRFDDHVTSPVPEPDSSLLFAAGLALVGFALTRRGK